MAKTTAIIKYEDRKKDLAQVRAERKLANFPTVVSRLNQSIYYQVMFGISLAYGLISGFILLDLLSASVFGTFMFFGWETAAVWTACSLVMMFLTLFGNKVSLRERFRREELKRLEEEEASLVSAKRWLMQHPDDAELQAEYGGLVAAVRRGRQEDREGE